MANQPRDLVAEACITQAALAGLHRAERIRERIEGIDPEQFSPAQMLYQVAKLQIENEDLLADRKHHYRAAFWTGFMVASLNAAAWFAIGSWLF